MPPYPNPHFFVTFEMQWIIHDVDADAYFFLNVRADINM